MSKTRILLADDHLLFREGIRHLLGRESDLEVAGEASDAGQAMELAAQLKPDLVLMDVGMPGPRAFEAAREIRRNRPETRVLFLTMYDDEDYLYEAMEAGSCGYVLKDSASSQMISAIRDVMNGGTYLSPKMLNQFVSDFRSRREIPMSGSRYSGLTPREREVLKMLAEGLSVKEIACQLDLSVKTIEAHKFNLMRKLDIHNKAHLVRFAIEKKIIATPTHV